MTNDETGSASEWRNQAAGGDWRHPPNGNPLKCHRDLDFGRGYSFDIGDLDIRHFPGFDLLPCMGDADGFIVSHTRSFPMDYTVLARRFRPQAFGEVVGQQNVAQALRNAIAADRVAHAYLFTGARGVGKTSMARILAKSLNCPNVKDGDPCNECDVCLSVSAGSDVDVLEIDGASNRGIEDIRSLRANVNVRSMRGRYKIYIIDEVHMLTREAFNALLKTLEEPPPNVKFIFCTTEPQKLPDTILSRCQRFDFGTIATFAIRQRLAEIAEAEGIAVAPEAVELVARRANGSMRDSQSLFDQLLAFGGKSIGAADVHRLLGTAPDERLIELTDSLITGDRGKMLALFQESVEAGVQLGELTDQLLGYFRDLMVLSAGAGGAELLSVSSERRDVLAAQASRWGLATILAALQILADTKGRMRGAPYGRVLVELALVRISMLEHLDEIGSLIQQLRGGVAAGGPPNRPAAAAPNLGSPARPLPRPDYGSQKKNDLSGAPIPAPVQAVSDNEPSRADSVATANGSIGSPNWDETAVPGESTRAVAVASVAFEPGRENEVWSQVLALLPSMAQSAAKPARPLAISGPNQLVLAFPTSYYKASFERLCSLSKVEQAAAQVTGRTIRVSLIIDETATVEKSSETPPVVKKELERPAVDLDKDPFVSQVKAIFNVEVR